jgi:signal transduction histidine kinase
LGAHQSRRIVIAVGLAALAVTVAWELAPGAHTVDAPALDIAMETAAALAALLFAFLLLGRFRVSRSRMELALVCSLGLLGGTNALYQVLPTVLESGEQNEFSAWAAIAGHMGAGAVFAWAAFAGHHHVGRRGARGAAAASVAVLVLAGAGAALLAPDGPPEAASGSAGDIVNAVAAIAFAAAAYVFASEAESRRDELLTWLAIAAALAAGARANYVIHPTFYTTGVGLGDALRLLDHAALVFGGMREIGRYWRDMATAAVAEERRRIARDFHDGMAQELAFISRRASRMGSDPTVADEVVAAAHRALMDARRAIAALRDVEEPDDLRAALARIGEHAARGTGAIVSVDVAEGLRLDAPAREEIGRIVGEAVTNAVHHGQARRVFVELRAGGAGLLRVRDDGAGFDAATPADGFGLTGMRERAERVGGELVLRSGPAGTEVEVLLQR